MTVGLNSNGGRFRSNYPGYNEYDQQIGSKVGRFASSWHVAKFYKGNDQITLSALHNTSGTIHALHAAFVFLCLVL